MTAVWSIASHPGRTVARPRDQMAPRSAEYVVPVRWSSDEDLEELSGYLRGISQWVDVTVVDGSDAPAFERHRSAFGDLVRHLAPDRWPGRNGKVAGVVTGVRRARHELVILADDDVRYTGEQLRSAVTRMIATGGDVLRPQNYFSPMPWHARWDTARSLVNRALGGDYPGTFVVRRSTFLRMGGYDGDVLFENLQMLRTFAAVGGRECLASDLFIARRPPTTGRFFGQRVRQAYDDFAQPRRLAAELSLLPLLSLLAAVRPRLLAVVAGCAVAVAEKGRRSAGGSQVFPRSAALWAPAWVLERAVCVWSAAGQRALGGVRYRGNRIYEAASMARVGQPLPADPLNQPSSDGVW